MRNFHFKLLLIFLSVSLHKFNFWGQDPPKSLITAVNDDFIVGMDNGFYVVAQQSQPIRQNQINATLTLSDGKMLPLEILGDNGFFTIQLDSLGLIEFNIQLVDGIEKKYFRVRPVPLVVQLSNFKAKEEVKISPGEFKAQRGISSYINCCGFDAKCEIESYDVIRITSMNRVERHMNLGGAFQPETRTIIGRTLTGDIYVFRNIYSKCSAAMEPQRLEDMTFEIE